MLHVAGIGEFGFHSYMIFSRDQCTLIKPTDANLGTFVRWRLANGGVKKGEDVEVHS